MDIWAGSPQEENEDFGGGYPKKLEYSASHCGRHCAPAKKKTMFMKGMKFFKITPPHRHYTPTIFANGGQGVISQSGRGLRKGDFEKIAASVLEQK